MYTSKRHYYVNDAFDYIVSANIKEYDIKSAGLSMLIDANAIDKKTIDYLSSLSKEQRTVKEGLMRRENKELTRIINDGLIKYRELFITANDIKEENIISVKKDAFFLVNKPIQKTIFNNVEFRAKHKYSSYYRLNKIEFYYSRKDDKLEIKGIDTDTKEFKKHKKYMIKFLKKLFSLNEVSRRSACIYLKQFADDYRKLKLDIGYYREFNTNSLYRLNYGSIAGNELGADRVSDKESLNIIYNYMHIIIPLIRLIY